MIPINFTKIDELVKIKFIKCLVFCVWYERDDPISAC
jgi:hypothetical protein